MKSLDYNNPTYQAALIRQQNQTTKNDLAARGYDIREQANADRARHALNQDQLASDTLYNVKQPYSVAQINQLNANAAKAPAQVADIASKIYTRNQQLGLQAQDAQTRFVNAQTAAQKATALKDFQTHTIKLKQNEQKLNTLKAISQTQNYAPTYAGLGNAYPELNAQVKPPAEPAAPQQGNWWDGLNPFAQHPQTPQQTARNPAIPPRALQYYAANKSKQPGLRKAFADKYGTDPGL